MKFFVVVVVLSVICQSHPLTEDQKQKLITYHKDCSAGTGIDHEVVEKARKGNFPEDPKFKEHLLCVSKKIGFQNDAGEIQKDVLKAKLGSAINDSATADKLIEKCAIKKGSPESTAFDTVKCYYENTPTHISIV